MLLQIRHLGSINQARMHVVEFLRWTTGVVPPELPKTTYTMQQATGHKAGYKQVAEVEVAAGEASARWKGAKRAA